MSLPSIDATPCPLVEVDPKDLAKYVKRKDFAGVTTRDGKTYVTFYEKPK